MSDESRKEVKDFLESPMAMVGSDKQLFYGLAASPIAKFSLFATSYYPLEE